MSNNDKIKYAVITQTLNAGDLIEEVPESKATHVLITKQDYHGLQKALRIVRDRAAQQVEKSETDEHGYQLLRAERRPYHGTSDEAWLVTRRTPYSVHMGISEVSEMLSRDLEEFYNVKIKIDGLSIWDLIRDSKHSVYCAGEIARISMDFLRGVYEVTYWVTQLR